MRKKGNMTDVKDMITFPEIGKGWNNSGEGGLAFFLAVPARITNDESDDFKCCIEPPEWGGFDVCLHNQMDNLTKNIIDHKAPMLAVITLGSIGITFLNSDTGEYFKPTYKDLTLEGKQLYDILEKSYRRIPWIVTLLDT